MTTLTQSKKERIKLIHDIFIALMWASKRQFVHWLQTFNLTFPQFITLAALVSHGKPATMSDLTGVTFQDAPTMTGIINRLVKMKLVERTRSERDRRVVLVQVTPAGQELAERINEEFIEDDLACCATLSDEELKTIERLLRFFLRNYLERLEAVTPVTDPDLELENLRQLTSDPIRFMQLENGKNKLFGGN